MPYPKKFKHLLEPDPASVPRPDYLWLAYAVCATEASACGWDGWIMDGLFRRTSERFRTVTGDQLLNSPDQNKCPQCGRPLFRTDISMRFEPSVDQSQPMRAGVDYEIGEMEYE